jgi:hypothetical protein
LACFFKFLLFTSYLEAKMKIWLGRSDQEISAYLVGSAAKRPLLVLESAAV